MELTINYILSQIFTIIMYGLLALTYYAKDRKKVFYQLLQMEWHTYF